METPRYELQLFHRFFNEHAEKMDIVEEFEEKLKNSLSLNREEKMHIIAEYPNLSEFQLRELIKVFVEEEKNMQNLSEEDLLALQSLINKVHEEWLIIIKKL